MSVSPTKASSKPISVGAHVQAVDPTSLTTSTGNNITSQTNASNVSRPRSAAESGSSNQLTATGDAPLNISAPNPHRDLSRRGGLNLKGNVQVVVRVRPLVRHELARGEDLGRSLLFYCK
jgi:hypothetical protein